MADEDNKPTVKAVVAEAKRLRERAVRERAADPWAKPYDPSEDVARKLASQLGPEGALSELGRRAAQRAADYREESERSERARKRLDRQQRLSDAERRQRLSGMTLGQRLDEALDALKVVSEVSAISLEPPVSRGKSDAAAPPGSDNRAGTLRERALMLVAAVEDEVPRARQRIEGRAA